MGQPVPADDLPTGVVPASDLPGSTASAASAAPVTPTEPSAFRKGVDTANAVLPYMTPWGMAAKGAEEVQKVVSKGAYNMGGAVTDSLASGKSSILNPYGIPVPHEYAAAAGGLTNFALEAIPAFLGGPAAKASTPAVIEKGGKALGERWMQQALQPSRAARESGDAEKAMGHLLTADTNQMSKGGVQRLTAEIDKLDEAVDAAIKRAPNAETVAVLTEQRKSIEKFKDGLEHATTSEAIQAEVNKFFSHPNVQGMLQIPAETAQAMKRAIGKEINWGKAPLESKTPEVVGKEEGKRAVVRGLNEGIAGVSPEVAAINKEMAPRIKARDLVEDRMGSHGNKMDVGLGYLAAHPWLIPAWLAERSPYFGALRARAAYQNQIPGAAGTTAGTIYGASTGLAPQEQRR